MPPKIDPSVHYMRTSKMLAETAALLVTFTTALVVFERADWLGEARTPLLVLTTICQGSWFHRLYTAAHEAIHRKLVPDNKLVNDIIGQALLLPLLIPVPVYRKIHKFHHTHNRRDHHTSTLDGYVVGDEPGYFKRVWIGLLWYLGVFAGGYFIHGVISILLFLFMPPVLARKISPAFENWSWSDQISSILIFAAGIGFHAGFWMLLGQDAWIAALGRPLLFFAWIYSLLVYIYHYRTTYGDQVVYNVRSVSAHGFFRWWLLNFNHHRVHHRYPTLPWHMLPDEPADLPDDFQRNENVDNIGQAIRQQLRGPQIFVEPKDER